MDEDDPDLEVTPEMLRYEMQFPQEFTWRDKVLLMACFNMYL
jgi:hypothetical protein